jgi:hypothetical protein
MKIKEWTSLALIAATCLLVEGAVVVALAFGLGNLLYSHYSHATPPVPACVPGIDKCS